MKNLKKLTAVLLTVVMIATMALVPAFAEEAALTGDAKICSDLGVLKGEGAGVTADYLAKGTTRLQSAIMYLRLLGLEDDAYAGTYTANFADAAKAGWADGEKILGYLKAHPELGWIGDGTNFDPQGATTVQMLDKVFLVALGYVEGTDFQYADAVSFAGTKNLTAIAGKTTITNADFAVAIVEALKANVKDGSKTLAAKLVDDGVITAAAAEAAGLISSELTATLAATGSRKLTVTFNRAIDTTKATFAVKRGTVTLATDGVTFADDKKSAVIALSANIVKGDYTVEISGLTDTPLVVTTTAEDVKVTKINIDSAKAPRVSGNNKQAIVSYSVLNQYGEKMVGQSINWTISTGVPASAGAKPGTIIITAANSQDFVPGAIVYITGVHVASGTVVNGSVEIGLAAQEDAVEFYGVYDSFTGAIGKLPANFAASRYYLLFKVKDQYGNTMTPTTAVNPPNFDHLIFTSNNPLFIANTFTGGSDVTIGSETYNSVLLTAGTQAANGGDVTIQVISTLTGKTSVYSISSEALAYAKTMTLSVPASIVAEGERVEIPFSAADANGNPVTSYNLINGYITNLNATAGTISLVKQPDGTAKIFWTAPTGTGANATTDYPVTISALMAGGGSFSSIIVYVKAAAVPTSVIGLDLAGTPGLTNNLASGASVTINYAALNIADQYGRTMRDSDVKAWLDQSGANSIVVTQTTGNSIIKAGLSQGADTATSVLQTSADTLYVTGEAGTTTLTEGLTFKLSAANDGSSPSEASAKAITFTRFAQIAYDHYELGDLGKMYNDGVAATTDTSIGAKQVKVYGVLASGTKVQLPASDYTVTTSLDSDGYLTTYNNNGVWEIRDVSAGGIVKGAGVLRTADNLAYADKACHVYVTVQNSSGQTVATLDGPMPLSAVPPVVTTIVLNSDFVTNNSATARIVAQGQTTGSATYAYLTGTTGDPSKPNFIKSQLDQYGNRVSTINPIITISGIARVQGSQLTVMNNGTNIANITGAAIGDKFTVTYSYTNGASVSIEFMVGAE